MRPLHALGAVTGSMAREDDPRGRQIPQAVIDDPARPALFAIQPQAEQDRCADPAETTGPTTHPAPLDLDAVVRGSLSRPHLAPLLR